MLRQSIKSKQYTRTLNKGLTFVEILIALGIGLTIMTAAFAITSSSRKLVAQDQIRTSVNQNARSALDLIGTDIRIAGERLSARSGINIPAIEIVDGKELILRRNLLNSTLSMCEGDGLTAGTDEKEIIVSYEAQMSASWAVNLTTYPQCKMIDTDTVDTELIPDSFKEWRTYRNTQPGGKARAFIYTVAGNKNEFFSYSTDDAVTEAGVKRFRIHRESGTWQNTYNPAELPSIVMLEEKRYKLNNGVIEAIVNADTATTQKIIDNVSEFKVRAIMPDGSVLSSLSSTQWTTVQSIQISITVKATVSGKNIERTLTSNFFPRNILSN